MLDYLTALFAPWYDPSGSAAIVTSGDSAVISAGNSAIDAVSTGGASLLPSSTEVFGGVGLLIVVLILILLILGKFDSL